MVCCKTLSNDERGLFEGLDGLRKDTWPHRRGSYYQRTIGQGIGQVFKFLGAGKERRGSDGGTRFAEGYGIRINDAQVSETEIAHDASHGADIQGIARRDKNHHQVVELYGTRH